MENLEKVEKIREKAGVSYEEAKSALEACDYDMLDALCYLEKLGKISPNSTASFSTQTKCSDEFIEAQKKYENDCKGNTIGDVINKFFDWCGRIIKKSCETTFEVSRNGNRLVAVPVIVLIVLVLFAFWITLPLLIVGMFMDCKYRFLGFESTKIDINEMCDKASDACGNIKADIQSKKSDK